MEPQMIFIYVAAAAGLAAFVGACLGARFVYKRMEHRRAVDSEHIRHRKDAARLKERLAERLAGKLEDAFEAARQERSETEKHRIESRLLADHEVEDIAWIFESDNLRDYYNGTVLVDTGWFDRNEIVAAVKGDPDERV